MELKNFTVLGLGLTGARSYTALTRVATSSIEQFNSFATCPANRRAGKSFAAQVVIAACVSSSVINQSMHLGIGILQAIPSGPPPARRSAPERIKSNLYVFPFILRRA